MTDAYFYFCMICYLKSQFDVKVRLAAHCSTMGITTQAYDSIITFGLKFEIRGCLAGALQILGILGLSDKVLDCHGNRVVISYEVEVA